MILMAMITSPYVIYRLIISEGQVDAANRLIKIRSKMLLFCQKNLKENSK